MKKVLVTGACGFIGSHLVDELVRRGYGVVATDLATAPKDFLNPEALFIPADLSEEEETKNLFNLAELKDIETLFHLGAVFDFNPPDSVMFKNNVIGTKNILNGFERLESENKRLILYSSGAIYGDTSSIVSAGENFLPDPKNAYGRSKFEQEEVLKSLVGEKTSFESVIIRPAAVIGSRSRYGAAKLLEFIADGKLQFFLGKKNLIAAIIHVEDLVNATIYLAECDWNTMQIVTKSEIPVFNVVDDSRYSYEELINYAAGLLNKSHGAKIIPFYLPLWAVKPIVWWQKYLAKKFGTRPQLTEGLLDFFKTPMTMNNFRLKSAGFDEFRYPDTKKAIKETIRWYLEEGWI